MIYDFRMYTLKPGATPDYMAGVREVGLPIRQRHGVTLSGWYHSDIGELNQVVHIWGFNDLNHMREAKAAVAADPDWTGKYLPRNRGLVEAQKTYLMNSPSFAPTYPIHGEAEPGSEDARKQNEMLYDFRMYTFKPGSVPDYMAAVEELAVPIRQKYGIKLAGWFYSDVGMLNQVVHIWAYNNEKHLIEGKAQVAADPDWKEKYVPRVGGLLTAQNVSLMKSTDFAPVPA